MTQNYRNTCSYIPNKFLRLQKKASSHFLQLISVKRTEKLGIRNTEIKINYYPNSELFIGNCRSKMRLLEKSKFRLLNP